MSRVLTVREIAAHVHGIAAGDSERPISGVNSPLQAGPRDIVFVSSPKHADELWRSEAGAVLLPPGLSAPREMAAIAVQEPLLAMIQVVDVLIPRERRVHGVSPLASLGRGVDLADDVGIGPFAAVGDGVRLGSGSEIHAGTTVGAGTVIGSDCTLHSGVHVYHDVEIGNRVVLHSGVVIGADGFGFVRPAASRGAFRGQHAKVRQLGRVVIEDDVEIGANSTIDRATFNETRIGCGTKIDNLVTIGHNCKIGRHCLIVGQVGISGSTIVGDFVVIAGQAGLKEHIAIGDGAVICAQSGVTKDVGPGETVLGSPAVDARRARKGLTLIDRLPDFKKSLADQQRRLIELEKAIFGGKPSE